MNRPTYLPNLLSSSRIAMAPAMLGAAYSNSKSGFAVLLALALLSDVLDGVFARLWHLESTLGRRLDRWGDALTMMLGALGVFFLWPGPVEAEWPWVFAALAGYGLIALERCIESADERSETRWWCKLASWAVPLSLWPWIADDNAWPFRGAAALQLAMGVGRCVGTWIGAPRAAGSHGADGKLAVASQ